MKDIIYLLFQLLTTFAKLLRPGGGRTVIAENLLRFHNALKKRKYRLLYSPGGGR